MPEKRENPQFILSKTKICNSNLVRYSTQEAVTLEPDEKEVTFFSDVIFLIPTRIKWPHGCV